jgi:hypothetical protein
MWVCPQVDFWVEVGRVDQVLKIIKNLRLQLAAG